MFVIFVVSFEVTNGALYFSCFGMICCLCVLYRLHAIPLPLPPPPLSYGQLCWSAHGNELRVHSTANLEPHAGHGTTGLPEQALFQFFSTSSDSDQPVSRHSNNNNNNSIVPRRTFQEPALRTAPLPPFPSSSLSRSGVVTNDGCCDTTHDLSIRSGGGGGIFREVSPRGLAGKTWAAGKKLPVRAVAAVEMREDGSTVLACLVSDHGVSSEVGIHFALPVVFLSVIFMICLYYYCTCTQICFTVVSACCFFCFLFL